MDWSSDRGVGDDLSIGRSTIWLSPAGRECLEDGCDGTTRGPQECGSIVLADNAEGRLHQCFWAL
jgi:hypothetical protein